MLGRRLRLETTLPKDTPTNKGHCHAKGDIKGWLSLFPFRLGVSMESEPFFVGCSRRRVCMESDDVCEKENNDVVFINCALA